MPKRATTTLILLLLLLTACAPKAAYAPEADFAGGAAEPSYEKPLGEAEAPPPAPGAVLSMEQKALPTERLVIKNADLSLVVSDPAQSMDAIAQLADEMEGFVVSSHLYTTQLESGTEVPRASITIRVPAERLNEALTQIKSLASRVLSENVSGEDVTQEYTDLQSRLRNLEAAEEQLTEIMGSATKTEDVLSVYNQLTEVREEIEIVKGRIQYYEQSAALSAISVELIPDEAMQPLTIGGWEPVGVAKDAIQALINTLKFLANATIWFTLFCLPVGLIVGTPLLLLWRATSGWRARRRRKSTPPAEPKPES